jgi:hypothetical protein
MVSPVSTFSHSGERVPLIHDANNNNIKSDEEEAKNDDAKMKTTTFTTAFAFVAFLSACAFAVSSLRGGKGSSGVSLLGVRLHSHNRRRKRSRSSPDAPREI